MVTIIAGSRSIVHYSTLLKAIELIDWEITEVVSGCAEGADRLGERYALRNNLKLTKYPADWERYGKSAGYKRNVKMADYIGKNGCLLCLWDGESKGAFHMINIAKRCGIKTFVYNLKEQK